MTTENKDNTDLSDGIIIGALIPFILPAILIPTILWNAFVLTKLWMWFAVPAFGLPSLGLASAYGLSLIVYLLRSTSGCKDEREWWVKLITPFFGPLLSLGMGWVATFFL